MDDGLKVFERRMHGKVAGVQSDFIGCLPCFGHEPFVGIVAEAFLFPLERQEAGRQGVLEKALVEMVVGHLEFRVRGRRGVHTVSLPFRGKF